MPTNYSSVIKEVMSEEVVSPEDIPEHTRRQGVRGYAQSRCDNCNRTWSSYRAHLVIDLILQEVVKIYQQKCKRCKLEQEPSFPETEFREMVKKAIKQEEFYRNGKSNDQSFVDDSGRRGRPRRPPHESSLCQKCGYGTGKNCWER